MLQLLRQLRQDENGVILSAEIVIVGSLLVVGMITGLTCLQQAVDGELRDVGAAIGALDQSYSFSSHFKPGDNGHCCAFTAGSSFTNCEQKTDRCDSAIVGAGCCESSVHIAPVSDCTSAGSACGSCGQSSCGGCGGCTSCGSCGNVGCGGCQSSGILNSGTLNGPRCLGTDVQNFRGTEWQSETPLLPVPPVPMADQLFPVPEVHGTVSADACLPECSPGTAFSSGDIVIPDHVW